MPTGDKVKGRLFNVVGDAIDGIGPCDTDKGCRYIEKPQNLKIYLLQLKFYTQELKLLIW